MTPDNVDAMRPIIDSHLDLAWNALYFDRDLLLSVDEVRQSEQGMVDELARGRSTLTLPELKNARVAVCLATLMARSGPDKSRSRQALQRTGLDYFTQEAAFAHTQGQLAYYRLLECRGQVRFISDRDQLHAHWDSWSRAPEKSPLGFILSMEGADGILAPAQVREWWEDGLRVVGPVHYGVSQYAHGTSTNGPLSKAGVELLKEFASVGMILDVTHLSDQSFNEALEVYSGPVLASHHNCRALVPGDRQMADDQIRLLIQRGGIIGTAFDAWMLSPGWERGITSRETVSMIAAADHIDHICQLAGNIRHCALGSDLDGGFGTEQTPRDLDTYSDLHKLEAILASRGYSDVDIDAIFYRNWLEFFMKALPVGAKRP